MSDEIRLRAARQLEEAARTLERIKAVRELTGDEEAAVLRTVGEYRATARNLMETQNEQVRIYRRL